MRTVDDENSPSQGRRQTLGHRKHEKGLNIIDVMHKIFFYKIGIARNLWAHCLICVSHRFFLSSIVGIRFSFLVRRNERASYRTTKSFVQPDNSPPKQKKSLDQSLSQPLRRCRSTKVQHSRRIPRLERNHDHVPRQLLASPLLHGHTDPSSFEA